jgi:hypothetical protein
MAQEVQRTRTTYINFPPTLLNDADTLEGVVRGLNNGDRFVVLRQATPPFIPVMPQNLVVSNGELRLAYAFQPKTPGLQISVVKLIRTPVNVGDTIVFRLAGEGYEINRVEDRDFGRVAVDAMSTRAVLARRGLAANEDWKVSVLPMGSPFSVSSSPIFRNDTAVFVCTFAPKKLGLFRDTAYITRVGPGGPTETISVRMVGLAVPFILRDTIEFGKLLIGDTTNKERKFKPPVPKGDYRVDHRPGPPFAVYLDENDLPIPVVGQDSLMIGAAFRPTAKGDFLDSIVIIRFTVAQEKPDTITYFFHGSAVTMPQREQVDFTGLTIGAEQQTDVTVTLPVEANVDFAYELVQITTTPATGKLVGSDSRQITAQFTAKPTVYAASTVQTFALLRLRDSRAVDSTVITVTTTMVPRPVNLTLKVDSVQARIGDVVQIPVRLQADGPIDAPLQISQMVLHMGYNPTLIAPSSGPGQEVRFDADSARVEITLENVLISNDRNADALFQVTGTVVMGDAEACSLPISVASVQPQLADVARITTQPGHLLLTNAWRYADGGGRYVNSIQGLLTLDVDPNPVSTTATMRVSNVPPAAGRLVVVDATGQLVADLTQELRSGTTAWTISRSSGSRLVLVSGTYYARLAVYGAANDELLSVTRLFIVE